MLPKNFRKTRVKKMTNFIVFLKFFICFFDCLKDQDYDRPIFVERLL